MSKAKVFFRECICGYHAWYRNREIATVTKRGFHWEVSDAGSLPHYVLSAVGEFAAEIAEGCGHE